MKRMRAVEETIAERYSQGHMRCPVHLSVGQEGVSAAIGLNLRSTDYAVSGHRAHIHYLAKGGDLKRMIAEIYGKVTGCSSGKGGSMHLIDESVGFKGSTAIVGGTIPVGVGLGFALKFNQTDNISVIFLGDGAIEEGVFYESVNFAALKKLPVLFVCENNLYSVYSHLNVRQPKNRKIYEMVRGMGLPAQQGDGNNPAEAFEICNRAVNSIRAGSGPQFLEFSTYRWREHCGPHFDNDIGYRTDAEFQEWKAKDPIAGLQDSMIRQNLITDIEIAEMDHGIQREIDEAFDFAIRSAFPKPADAHSDLYWDEVNA
jgi:pyruvate dehydrogenase E1 component alpha subunit